MGKKARTLNRKTPTTLSTCSEEVTNLLGRAYEYHKSGALDKAQELYTHILTHHTDHPDALHLLGLISYQKGDMDTAENLIKKAVTLNPLVPDYNCNLGNVLSKLGRHEEAISYYRDAIRLKPDFTEAYNNLGSCLRSASEIHESIECYKKALEIDPDNDASHNNLGNIFTETGAIDQAIFHYQQALRLNPRNIDAYMSLGKALSDRHDFDNAIAYFNKAIEINPDFAEAYLRIGVLHMSQLKLSEAVSSFQKALDLDAAYDYALCNMGNIQMLLGNIQEAIAFYQKALELNPEISVYFSNILLALNYSEHIAPEDVYAKHQKWSERYELPLKNLLQPHANDSTTDRKLRIGYVSPDFKEHPVSHFFEPLLASHDRSNFEIYCYSNVKTADAMTEHLKGLADTWRDIHNASDEDAAGMIRRDKIDILVDLAGHTGDNRMMLFARKPSPVQITYLGYPNTTGLEAMDYRITDSYADPPGKTEHLHSEELVRLPHGFLCYQPHERTPDVGAPPSLKEKHITFGCFNNGAKITPGMVRVWAEILDMIPNARILFKFRFLSDPLAQRLFKDMLDRANIPFDRVELHDYIMSEESHLDLYNRVDIALDTFPYNGTTTTCEALWMGVPVITLGGQVHASRVGLSILSALGMPELVAGSKEEYRQKAVGLAADIEKRIHLRSNLRSLMRSSPLMDAKVFTQDVEDAYRKIWLKRCALNKDTLQKDNHVANNKPRKLHIGGTTAHPEWEIFNALNKPYVDHLGNAKDLSRFEDNTFDELYASHVLEHFDYDKELISVLREWNRVIKPGGRIYISVPDLDKLASLFLKKETISLQDRFLITRMILGGHMDDYDYHKVAFNGEILSSFLHDAGFCELRVVDNFRIFNDTSAMLFNGVPISINMVAEKPGSHHPENNTISPRKADMREDKNQSADDFGQNIEHSPSEQSMKLTEEGEAHFNAGDIEEALRAFNKALEINPENVTALNNLGVLYWHKGDVQKAIENLQLALRIDPSAEDAGNNLQEILKAQDNGKEQQDAGPADKPEHLNETFLQVTIKGGIQVCVPPSIQNITPYILIEQEDWFEDEIRYVRKILEKGMKVIDVGANYGLYSHSMSKIIGPSGNLWAFEPARLTASFLRKTIAINQLANITLVETGLSDKKGTAKISLNPDPEMNVITTEPDSGGKYETVELVSLDECESIYEWDNIDFVKLSAKGQGHNIIMGGRHFLSANSPLIMFELKQGSDVNHQLIQDFMELGYQLFRLIPGLNILAPIDLNRAFDPFQLNLFCCKADRAKLLQEKGLLITEFAPSSPISDTSLWQKKLETLPYYKVFQISWASIEQAATIPGWDHYQNALNYYVMAHGDNQSAHSRYACLYQSWEECSKALEINGNICRMLTLTRILSELGKRDDSLRTVDRILNLVQTENIVQLTEPFIPVSARFEHLIPTDMNKWLVVSILEYREKAMAFSSYYTGSSSLNNLEVIKQLGYQSPEMERRRQLIRMRYGMQSEPIATPMLSRKTQDNLNPELWNNADLQTNEQAVSMIRRDVHENTKTGMDASRPRLSICIPTYNRADLLRETLAHLEHVCDDDVEIVISDNCSPDRTQEVIETFRPRFRHFRSIRQPENLGPWKNAATVMSLASGKYIYTLCDDDEIYIDGLNTAVSIMEENPRITGVYGAYQEWDRTSDKILSTLSAVDLRTDFVQCDKLSVFNRFGILWLPVCRTDIFQRYFAYDKKSFGMWELVGTLLEHGDISIIPDIFYKHALTIPRMEYELTESWYHDSHRAQYECYVGRIGPLNFYELSTFINGRVASAYTQGLRFAEIKREFLTCRHFLLRSRAYGLFTDMQIMEWEKKELVNMVAERLLGHLELIPEIKEVIFEDTPNLQVLSKCFSSIAPEYDVGLITQGKWKESGLGANQYLVIYSYESDGWSKAVELGPVRCRSARDMIETCRITDQPLDF